MLLCHSPRERQSLGADYKDLSICSEGYHRYSIIYGDTHIALGFPDPRAHSAMPRLDRIQAGVRRVLASRGKKKATRLPLTPVILERMRQHWASCGDENWQLYWATAAICYFGFFRLGELILPTDAPNRALLNWGDATFDHASQPTLLKIHLHVAKCDQFGEGTDVFIPRALHTWLSGASPQALSSGHEIRSPC